MRINRKTLIKIARDTVKKRTAADHSIMAVYLCGSLLQDEFLLGGTADIDLVMIHYESPETEREIVRITDEIHVDIAHHSQKLYSQPKELRLHPWLGPTLFDCEILYDPQHFLDFTQASVRGQFNISGNKLRRSSQCVEHARQIWFSFDSKQAESGTEGIFEYLRALELCANAIACLNGQPLTERRFLLDFPARAQAVKRPGLYQGLLGLLGAGEADAEIIESWIADWRGAFQSLPDTAEIPALHPDRIHYYQRAFEAILGSGQPLDTLWPLIHTWTRTVAVLPPDSPHANQWRKACEVLGLAQEAFSQRLQGLDAFLDQVEEILDVWAEARGVRSS